jgi:hypothetical protein
MRQSEEQGMGLLSRLFGRAAAPELPALLRARISADDNYRYRVTWVKIDPRCQAPEHIRLVAHYYAKVLFNHGAGNDAMGESARVCLHFMRTLLSHSIADSSDILNLADIGDTATLLPDQGEIGHWRVEATLYFVAVPQRHITTDFPRVTTAQQVVFSVFVLIQSALRQLSDPEDRRMLEAVLRNMQATYEGGANWADATNLALVPTRAMNDAILG